MVKPAKTLLAEPSLLHLKIEGVITGESEFLDHLIKYRGEDNIKGILIEVNSPGGVVGPSQEMLAEIKRVRTEFKKPVVVSCGALAASGAYYAAVGADKIIVNPGTLMGSIGVIMQFANLEKLYEWAKMDFTSITTGKFKDSGSPYRPMTGDERQYFQDLIDQVHSQFKTAVMEGREMRQDELEPYADGRIFNGKWAVENGFADELGTLYDARKILGKMAGIEDEEPILFEPKKSPENIMEWVNQNAQALVNPAEKVISEYFRPELTGQPLYLMPGVLSH